MPEEEARRPPLNHGWEAIPDGPFGLRRYVPDALGWIYSIASPPTGETQPPFFVPDEKTRINLLASRLPGQQIVPLIQTLVSEVLSYLHSSNDIEKVVASLQRIETDVKSLATYVDNIGKPSKIMLDLVDAESKPQPVPSLPTS